MFVLRFQCCIVVAVVITLGSLAGEYRRGEKRKHKGDMTCRRALQITYSYARAEKKEKHQQACRMGTYYVSWEGEIVGLIAVGIPDGCKNSISF